MRIEKLKNFFQPALSLIAVYLLAQSQFNAIMSRLKLLACEHLRHISMKLRASCSIRHGTTLPAPIEASTSEAVKG